MRMRTLTSSSLVCSSETREPPHSLPLIPVLTLTALSFSQARFPDVSRHVLSHPSHGFLFSLPVSSACLGGPAGVASKTCPAPLFTRTAHSMLQAHGVRLCSHCFSRHMESGCVHTASADTWSQNAFTLPQQAHGIRLSSHCL